MESKFKVGDIVISVIPENKNPYHPGFCWIDEMDCFAGKPYEISEIDFYDRNETHLYKLNTGRGFSYYDFWLVPAETSNFSVDENDLKELLGE